MSREVAVGMLWLACGVESRVYPYLRVMYGSKLHTTCAKYTRTVDQIVDKVANASTRKQNKKNALLILCATYTYRTFYFTAILFMISRYTTPLLSTLEKVI